MGQRYQVVAAYVMCKLNTYAGVEVRGFDRNAVLPDQADEENVARLLRKGMITEFDGPDVGAVGPPYMDPGEAAAGAQAAALAAEVEAVRDSAPSRSARKEVWVAYAQSRGDLPEDRLAEMTIAELAEHYLGPAE